MTLQELLDLVNQAILDHGADTEIASQEGRFYVPVAITEVVIHKYGMDDFVTISIN